MSKIKLVVEIDEETYNDIQSRDWKNGELVFSEEWKAIHNGTPLDDLRAEIEKISIAPFATAYTAKHEALEIIDRYREGANE